MPFPHGRVLACGLAAGVAGGLSLTAFYVALARGAMGASAAISGLLAAAIPVAIAIFADGAPGLRRGLGFVVAGAAIWLIAAGPSGHEQPGTVALAIGAGGGFGLYFVALKYASPGGLIWPMATRPHGQSHGLRLHPARLAQPRRCRRHLSPNPALGSLHRPLWTPRATSFSSPPPALAAWT